MAKFGEFSSSRWYDFVRQQQERYRQHPSLLIEQSARTTQTFELVVAGPHNWSMTHDVRYRENVMTGYLTRMGGFETRYVEALQEEVVLWTADNPGSDPSPFMEAQEARLVAFIALLAEYQVAFQQVFDQSQAVS